MLNRTRKKIPNKGLKHQDIEVCKVTFFFIIFLKYNFVKNSNLRLKCLNIAFGDLHLTQGHDKKYCTFGLLGAKWVSYVRRVTNKIIDLVCKTGLVIPTLRQNPYLLYIQKYDHMTHHRITLSLYP